MSEVTQPSHRIKLIVSDMHLGVGKYSKDGAVNTLEEFFYDEKFKEFLTYYRTGKYENAEVELILNGDILNFLQVDYKEHYVNVITESMTLNKFEKIYQGHQVFFEELKKFLKVPHHSLTYITGNHDQGILWPAVRERFNEVLEFQVKYKNIFYFFDGVHIEHGHMHEAANRFNPKKFFLRKDMPEPILNLPFGSHFFVEFVMKIKRVYPHIDKVRPIGKMARWLFVNRPRFTMITAGRLVKYFVGAIFNSDRKKSWNFPQLIKILVENTVFPDLTEGAKKLLQDDRIHTVVFGHSHGFKHRQWGNGKDYFNTGTWTELTSLDVNNLGKVTKLTYVMFEYPENSGIGVPRGRLKEWKGYYQIHQDL